ncbi:hypothetical protein O6H91_12G014200 [Diphasiastrum complanatum]|uniref:Uncharacterized protein n=1 Tax=Diphasiastrum complanatum TaxID=34168 RepID=A0ACC2BZ31_DIPCM|nr:hypothetical protein O6H91_12G014200 [Diphasiastrum complanatum]
MICDLPQEVLEKILTYLQVRNLGKCVSVCKKWKSLVDSQTFQTAMAQVEGPKSFLLFHGLNWQMTLEQIIVDGWIVFDINNSSWFTLRNNFLLSHLNEYSSSYLPTFSAVSEGGLICVFFRNWGLRNGKWNLLGLVCNPVTKAVRKLPCLELDFTDLNVVIILHMDEHGGRAYKVFFLSKVTFCLYDSEAKIKSWDTLHRPSSKGDTPLSGVMLRSTLYILWRSDFGRLAVAAYNINKHVWSEKVHVPALPANIIEKSLSPPQLQLVIVNHDIFLTGIFTCLSCRANCSIIWKVMEANDEKGIVLDELARTCVKEMIQLSLVSKTPTPEVAENCIVVTERTSQGGLFVMIYDLHGKVWRHIPHSCKATCECCRFCIGLTRLCQPQGRWMSLNMGAKV